MALGDNASQLGRRFDEKDAGHEGLAREVAIRVRPPVDRGLFETLGEIFSRHRGDRRVSFEIELSAVPKHLRDTHYKAAARLGSGKGYKYAHDFDGGLVEQDYLGVDITYYEPTDRGFEAEIGKRLERLRSRRTGPGAENGAADNPPALDNNSEDRG